MNKPNYTQIPNVLLDNMADFTNAEFKVIMYICRRTFGFQKQSDKIALSQMLEGIKTEDRVLDTGTGLSRQGILNCLDSLESKGYITSIKRKGKTTNYVVNLVDNIEVVKSVDQTSQLSVPQVVNSVDTQKKEKKSLQKKDSDATSQDLINSKMPIFQPLNKTGYKRWYGNKTQRKAVKDLLDDFTPEQLKKKIAYIVENRHQDEPYQFPSITTPLQLQQKHQNVMNWEVARKKHLTK